MSSEDTPNDDFLRRKWEHAFYTFFDLNHDGMIDKPDFDNLIEVVGQVRGTDSDEYMVAKLHLPEVWQKIAEAMGKTDKDKVSLNEWITMWSKTLSESTEPSWENSYLNYIFRLFDASGDLLIDQAEYVQVLGYYAIPKDDALYCFDRFSVNSDGEPMMCIDNKKFVRLWKEYFHSRDRGDPGNYLLGLISFDEEEDDEE